MSHPPTISTAHTITQEPDSPGLHGRSSYTYDTSPTDTQEKYGSKGNTQHIEQRNGASSIDIDSDLELDHVTEFPNKWAKIRCVQHGFSRSHLCSQPP